jgi:hypothetical protein
VKLADGTASEELLTESDLQKAPSGWSSDGKLVVFSVDDPKTRWDIWTVPLIGDHKPVPIIQTEFAEQAAQVSPDGKWIAYQSDETGRPEIYIKPFPTGTGKWQVSTEQGVFPRWRAVFLPGSNPDGFGNTSLRRISAARSGTSTLRNRQSEWCGWTLTVHSLCRFCRWPAIFDSSTGRRAFDFGRISRLHFDFGGWSNRSNERERNYRGPQLDADAETELAFTDCGSFLWCRVTPPN